MFKSKSFLVFCLFFIVSTFCYVSAAEKNIYDNSDENGWYFFPGSNQEVLDYGRSNGGNISRFRFKYYANSSYSGTVRVKFYRATSDSYEGSLVKSFYISGLQHNYGSNTLDYQIPENQQFQLPGGRFGYSFTFNRNDYGPALASGGYGNETYFWAWDEWYQDLVPTYFTDGTWGGFYMQVYAAEPEAPEPDPNTCDISGHVFYDANSNGAEDSSETGLSGQEIFLDYDGDGIFDAGEPNTVTDINGDYEFNSTLADGVTFDVLPILEDGWFITYPSSGSYYIDPDPNGVYSYGDFGLSDVSEITLRGYVRDESNSGISNVLVEAYSGIGTNISPSGFSDYTSFDGFYSFTVKSPFTGVIIVDMSGYKQNSIIQYVSETSNIYQNITMEKKYSGGVGSSGNPYRISSYDDMMELSESPEDYDKYFVVTRDINLRGNVNNFSPIGSSTQPFRGVFDGNGYSLSYMSCTTTEYVAYMGMFAYVDSADAIIKNVDIISPIISGGANSSGALVGVLKNGIISDCSIYYGIVSGGYRVGALAGCVYSGGTIVRSSAVYGTCKSQYDYCGGFVGYNEGMITNCFTAFNVECNSTRGGGFVGENAGPISYCYSLGEVQCSTYAGGFCGFSSGNETGCFWDIPRSGLWYSNDDSTGVASTEMVNKSFYQNAGWDFADDDSDGTEDYWKIYDGINYPYLARQTTYPIRYSGGSGSILSPWIIEGAADLYAITLNPQDWNDCFILIDDIDMENVDFLPIGDSSLTDIGFSGKFDGQGHTISNIDCDPGEGQNYSGLFGFISGGDVQIKNLGLLNCNFVNGGNGAGSIAGGVEQGTIKECWVEGCQVQSHFRAGGLVGTAGSGCQIENCYSKEISAGVEYNFAGGFAGSNAGIISNCYCADANISGSPVAAFVSENSGSIINCLFDQQMSNISFDNHATGLSTSQMYNQSSFLDVNWDFAFETENGTEDIWHMPYQSTGYPMLWYQKDIPGDIAAGYGVNIIDFETLAGGWLSIYSLNDLEILAENWLAQ